MWFDNRRVVEIKLQEITDLLNTAQEDQWLEFKQYAYQLNIPNQQVPPKTLDEEKFEMLKDISAMANAEGGYIILGIAEKQAVAVGFMDICDPEKTSKRIKDICSQYIEPRIQNLEIEPYQVSWKDTTYCIIIIHIPPSSMRPHCIKWKNTSVFVKRHQDDKRDMSISELGEAFSTRYYPQVLDSIHSRLETIAEVVRVMQETERTPISPQEDALKRTDVSKLLQLMELRFQTEYPDLPYYRIISVPQHLEADLIPTEEERIRNILENPSFVRYGGFGFRGISRVIKSPEGCLGTTAAGQQEITLLKNGFLELRCPLYNNHFQWLKEQAGLPANSNWLYPYAVCEYPVSFLKLVRRLYSESEISLDNLLIRQEYWHLNGFTLQGGHPNNPFFGMWKNEYTPRPHIPNATKEIKLNEGAEFSPDQIAYELVKDIYSYFDLDESSIPLFDENHMFVP